MVLIYAFKMTQASKVTSHKQCVSVCIPGFVFLRGTDLSHGWSMHSSSSLNLLSCANSFDPRWHWLVLLEEGWIQTHGLGMQKFPEASISAHTGGSCSLQTSFVISVVTLLHTAETALPWCSTCCSPSGKTQCCPSCMNNHEKTLCLRHNVTGLHCSTVLMDLDLWVSYLCPCLSNYSLA